VILLLFISHKQNKPVPDPLPKNADIVIVGAGTAGCIVAKRLNETFPEKQIVILERGKDQSDDSVVYNVSNANKAASNEPYSERIPLKTSLSQKLFASQGTMYGGSSSHNYAQAVHGSSQFYNENWLVLGMNYWDYLPYIKKIENYTGKSQDFHLRGNRGELSIIQLTDQLEIIPRIPAALNEAFGPIGEGLQTLKKSVNTALNVGPLGASDKFIKSFNKAVTKTKNVPIVEDYNTDVVNCTVGKQQLYINYGTGLRSSPNVTYLRKTTSNVKVVPNAYVEQIKDERILWTDQNGTRHNLKINENGKMVISAGGIYTPQLLLRSKFENIGNKLITHYGLSMIATIEDENFSVGPMAFLPKDTPSNKRDWQLVVGGDLFVNFELIKDRNPNLNYIAFTLWLLNPKSRGRVTQNEIEYNFFEEEDLQNSLEGMKYLYRLINDIQKELSTLKIVYPPPQINENSPDPILTDYIKRGISVTSHWCNTCPLGLSVDPKDFSLYQQKNVHVVDASVFPEIPDGNTEFPTCLIGEIAAERIANVLK
jgi:choline dehydrogenase